MFVKPPGPRHTSREIADGLEFHLPARRHLGIVIGLGLWLLGWGVGGIVIIVAAVNPAPNQEAPPLFVALIWFAFGAVPTYVWFWMLKGREIVGVTSSSLAVKRALFGWGREKQYDPAQVRALRVSPQTFTPWDFSFGLSFWGLSGGVIAFDYGYKTFRFGGGIDEAEARHIVERILQRFPALGKMH